MAGSKVASKVGCRPCLPVVSAYNVFFPSAFTFAHLALAAAASLALTAGLLRRSFFLATFDVTAVPFTLAHLAFVAAMMAALPAALNRLLPFLAGLEAVAALPLILAHLALAPAAILARAAADMRRFFGTFTADGDGISPSASDRIDLALQLLDLFLDGNDMAELPCR